MLLMNIDLIMAETDSITSFTALLLHNRCARNWRLKDDLPEKVGKSPVKFSLGLVSGTFVKSSRVEGVGIDRLTGCLPALFQNLSTMTMKSYIITTYTMSTMATMALLFTISNHIFFFNEHCSCCAWILLKVRLCRDNVQKFVSGTIGLYYSFPFYKGAILPCGRL